MKNYDFFNDADDDLHNELNMVWNNSIEFLNVIVNAFEFYLLYTLTKSFKYGGITNHL